MDTVLMLYEIVKEHAVSIYHYPNRGWIVQVPGGEQGVSLAYSEKKTLEEAVKEVFEKLGKL